MKFLRRLLGQPKHPGFSPSAAPDLALAEVSAALALHQSGRFDAAAQGYEAALGIDPHCFDALQLRGTLALQVGEFALAVEYLDQALVLLPDRAEVRSNLALALRAAGRPNDALAHFDRAIQGSGGSATLYLNRAITYRELGQSSHAMVDLRHSVELDPAQIQALVLLGQLLADEGQPEAAREYLQRALALGTEDLASLCGLASIELASQHADQALALLDRAVTVHSTAVEAYINRGFARYRVGMLDQAIADFDSALKIDPANITAYLNRGAAREEQGRYDLALANYDDALRIAPENPQAHANRGFLLLLLGELKRGWPEFDYRRRDAKVTTPWLGLGRPRWSGRESLEGKTIAVFQDEGFGDVIQFARLIPRLSALGARVVVDVAPALHAVVAGVAGISAIVRQGSAVPDHDFYCGFVDLPGAFGLTEDQFDAPIKIQSGTDAILAWHQRLGSSSPRIGLVWSGRPEHGNDLNRSIRLETLIEALPFGPQYVSLQQQVRDADATTLGRHPEILHFGQELASFADTAALCECIDLVISVDTSVAHLAASCGRPVLLLLPFVPDWRWMLDRSDSPWYPSMVLLRQPHSGSWGACLTELAGHVSERMLRASGPGTA